MFKAGAFSPVHLPPHPTPRRAASAVLPHSPNRHVPGLEGTVILHALLEGHTPVLLAQHQQQRGLHLGAWGVVVSSAPRLWIAWQHTRQGEGCIPGGYT